MVVDEPHSLTNALAELQATLSVSLETKGDSDKEAEHKRERSRRYGEWKSFTNQIGRRYAECRLATFDASDPQRAMAKSKLAAWCETIKERVESGQGVVLHGPRGTGKDHLAVAAMHIACKEHGLTLGWCDGQTLFADARDRIDRKMSEHDHIQEISRPSILLISDPVPQDGKLTDFQQSTLWRIIDLRYRRLQSTWMTANAINEADLTARMGAQLVDRLTDGALFISTAGWKSYRKPAQLPAKEPRQ